MQSKSINLKFRYILTHLCPLLTGEMILNLYEILSDVQPNDDTVILKTSNLNNEHVMNGRYFYF